MTIRELSERQVKKVKRENRNISKWLPDGSLPKGELLAFAKKAKDIALKG